MTARVHGVAAGREIQAGVLGNRQRVHIRAQQDYSRPRPRAAQDGDDGSQPGAGRYLQGQVADRGEHRLLRQRQREAQLRLPVDLSAQLDELVLHHPGLLGEVHARFPTATLRDRRISCPRPGTLQTAPSE